MRLGELWKRIIEGHAGITEHAFLTAEINEFMQSQKRKDMITAREYYLGKQDILHKRRTIVDENGVEKELKNVPNSRIVDNKIDDLVDQKTNYLLANPIEVQSDDDLVDIFNNRFNRKLKNIGRDAIISGIAYLIPYIDAEGLLQFKKAMAEHILPFWADDEHTKLDAFMYIYPVEVYKLDGVKDNVYKVEYYTPKGIRYYEWTMHNLTPDVSKGTQPHYMEGGQAKSWRNIPLIPFKRNESELSLIKQVKSLQDALNTLISNFSDNMQEDIRSTILVIKNYEGENLDGFRQKLATYGAIKVKSIDGVEGGVDALNIEVDASNYDVILKMLRRSIIENGRGFDAKDERMSNNPNQMNIQSMYSDIDLDTNDLESEFQASLELLMEFVSEYKGREIEATFIFNRDLPVNQSDVINNCKNSVGIISKETIIANHPWTINTDEELKRLKAEEEEQIADFVVGGKDEQQSVLE